jgi:homeobox-leucine zipper protein
VDTVGSKETKMILQNSSYDISGSFLVYSPLEKELTEEMNLNLGSGNQEMGNTSLFPTGFFLVPIPDALKHSSNIGEAGGTVMTAGHQTVLKLARGTGLCPRAVSSLIKFMSEHVANVKDTLMNSHPIFYKGTPSTV